MHPPLLLQFCRNDKAFRVPQSFEDLGAKHSCACFAAAVYVVPLHRFHDLSAEGEVAG